MPIELYLSVAGLKNHSVPICLLRATCGVRFEGDGHAEMHTIFRTFQAACKFKTTLKKYFRPESR